MLESLKFVGTQVLILFIIMAVGFVCRKLRVMNESGVKGLTDLMLCVITPCMMFKAFQQPFETSLLRGFLITLGVVAVMRRL